MILTFENRAERVGICADNGLDNEGPDPEGLFSPLKTAPRGSGSVLIMAWTMKARIRIRNGDTHL